MLGDGARGMLAGFGPGITAEMALGTWQPAVFLHRLGRRALQRGGDGMTPTQMTQCPVSAGAFRHDDALEPDPFLARIMATPVCPVRMPYGEGMSWLVTDYANVRTVTSDRRFSRAALIGTDYPRITPAPIAQPEAINLMDPPTLNRLRHVVPPPSPPPASSSSAPSRGSKPTIYAT